MKRPSKVVKTSLLVIISSSITLLFGEFLVRMILPQDKMVTWIEMHEEGFMMNQSGGNAFQELGDRKAFYRFNEQRLRSGEVSNSKINILAVGDSFTFGLLLNEEDTYIHHLQRLADGMYPDSIQFLNGGVGGTGLGDWSGWLEHYGKELSPSYLIYFMNYDDINRTLSKNLYVYDPNAPDSLIKSQRWKPRSFMFKIGQKNWYRWLQANSELANVMVKLLWKNVYFKDVTSDFDPEHSEVPLPSLDSYSEKSDYSNRLTNAILEKIDAWCDENGCEFLIVNTGFFEKENMSMYDKKFYTWLQDSTRQTEGVYFDNIDCVQSNVDSSLDELKIPDDSHPNEEGAKIIADCTWEKLVNKLGNQ